MPQEVRTTELTKVERETIINFNEGERSAGIYTHNAALKRKLEQLAQDHPDDCHLTKASHDGEAMDYTIPKSWIKIRPPRVPSQAQKEAWRKSLQKTRL